MKGGVSRFAVGLTPSFSSTDIVCVRTVVLVVFFNFLLKGNERKYTINLSEFSTLPFLKLSRGKQTKTWERVQQDRSLRLIVGNLLLNWSDWQQEEDLTQKPKPLCSSYVGDVLGVICMIGVCAF